MSNHPAKFASALVIGVAAGAVLTALPASPARAADNCLTEPGKDPQGKHWYFHIERGTGRHCWYLRDQDDKSARAATSDAPAERPVPRLTDAATSRSIADAHAEIAPHTPVADDAPAATAAAPTVWPSPQAATTTANNAAADAPASAATADQSALAQRWPQASNLRAAPAAAAQQPDATLMVADAGSDSSAATDPAPQAVPPPALAAAPVERDTGSLQKLLLVAAGALALAGITGSAVYRLGSRRRRNDWLRERSNWQSVENPLEPPWVAREPAPVNPTVPDLDEAREMTSRAEPLQAFESDASGDRVEKIEEFLARLTQQLHAELEGTQRTERGARASS